jgi:hypothetical protein
MKCSISDCNDPVIGLFTWGPYPDGERNKDVALCDKCSQDLWERVKGLVSRGDMHYTINPPRK